jgi:hypothetical protein
MTILDAAHDEVILKIKYIYTTKGDQKSGGHFKSSKAN